MAELFNFRFVTLPENMRTDADRLIVPLNRIGISQIQDFLDFSEENSIVKYKLKSAYIAGNECLFLDRRN